MADFFNRFLKRWGSTGQITEPSAAQADVGFSFLGSNPPSVEMFNALFQQLDEKDNWLYTRLTEVLTAAGITPSSATQGQLLLALRNMFAPAMWQTNPTVNNPVFIVPVGITKVLVRVWGGGGGGGGCYLTSASGTGGGGGGYAEQVVTVSPGASIPIIAGAGGSGGNAQAGVAAQAGGITSFGSFVSATGGSGGLNGSGIIATGNVVGGMGFGDNLYLAGNNGDAGYLMLNNVNAGGVGGSSPFGGSLSPLTIAGSGKQGVFPGGGGSGAGSAPGGGNYTGGVGANGFVQIYY